MPMSQIADRPGIISIPIEEDLLGGFGGFPDRLYLVSAGEGKFAANNATLPDGQVVDGLACFPSMDDATVYMAMPTGLAGEVVSRSFEEAREIAKSKPKLNCLLLFVDGKIVEVHFVR
jgi:hypothetical protein